MTRYRVTSERTPGPPGGTPVSDTITELRQAGLLDDADEPRLTTKGRDWLHLLEDLQAERDPGPDPSDEDFVLSTNGLFR